MATKTILELFEGSTLDKSVKEERETFLEQETSGIRVRSLVELNNPLIYGNEAIRIANRTTSTLDRMEEDRGNNGAGIMGAIGIGLGAITAGQITSLSQGRDALETLGNSVLGMPSKQIPSTVVQRIKNNPNHDTSIPVQPINTGTEIGKILKDVGGNPETIAKQVIGRGIGFAKDKVRNLLYGANPDVNDADGNERGFIQKYTNKNIKSKDSGVLKSLESYRGISNDVDIVNLVTSGDNVTIKSDGEFEYKGTQYRDLIPFYIGKALDDKYTMFRANLTGISETVSPQWNNHKFLGNPFNFYTYGGVERSVSFSLQIYAGSKAELATNWEKISQLTGMTYPTINPSNLVNPPIIKFRLGDIYYNAHGFIESLSYTIPDSGVWETEEAGALLPKFIDAAITIKLIEDTSALKALYGYTKSKAAIDSLNNKSGATQMSGDLSTRQIEKPIKIDKRGMSNSLESFKPQLNLELPGSKGSIKNTIKTLLGIGKRKNTELLPEEIETGVLPPNSAQSDLIVDKKIKGADTALGGISGKQL